MYNVNIEEVSAKSSQGIEDSMMKVAKILMEREEKKSKVKIISTSEKKLKLGREKSSLKEKFEGLNTRCNRCDK